MTNFTALGDSITLGIGDPIGGGKWRGWAVLLAESLPDAMLHNLAAAGARARDVEQHQLPRALELRPDVASVIVGINDMLRQNFDPAEVAAAATHTVSALRSAGAVVLTMRLPDPGMMLGMPAPLAKPLARRAAAVNMALDEVAARFGTLHFDPSADGSAYDRPMWAIDRLHPSERGHRHIACSFHDQLTLAGHPVGPRPDTEPTNKPPGRVAQAAWLATKGTAWLMKRSTDLLPGLVTMAAGEWFRAEAGPAPVSEAPASMEGIP